jgi:hypothetical protein
MVRILLIIILILSGCKVNVILAPKGSVPKRTDLEKDGYGGYFTLVADGNYITGELIGTRNDSIVVLSDMISKVHRDEITYGQVIVHNPNNYLAGGLIPMFPNLILMTIGGYGGSPVVLGLILSAFNAAAWQTALDTENLKFNYFEWKESPVEVLKYSRFPGGIPKQVNLDDLQPRPIPHKQKVEDTPKSPIQ